MAGLANPGLPAFWEAFEASWWLFKPFGSPRGFPVAFLAGGVPKTIDFSTKKSHF